MFIFLEKKKGEEEGVENDRGHVLTLPLASEQKPKLQA